MVPNGTHAVGAYFTADRSPPATALAPFGPGLPCVAPHGRASSTRRAAVIPTAPDDYT
jgi:hypothetical protein